MKYKHIIVSILFSIILLIISTKSVHASTITSDNASYEAYSVYYSSFDNLREKLDNMYIGDTLDKYYISGRINYLRFPYSTTGKFVWENPKYIVKEGLQSINIIFEDSTYFTNVIFTIQVNGIINEDDAQNTSDNQETEESAIIIKPITKNPATTLTTASLLLETSASYDINLIDREDGATYEWSSSDTKIATVNKKGVVKGLKNGQAKITCKVTTVDDKVYELNSNVTVDNISEIEDVTTLSDSELELTVNDTFDIDVENKLTKAKVKFVSLDKSVAKVTSVGGIVTALKKGNTKIQCTITNPNKEVIVLLCDVVVE